MIDYKNPSTFGKLMKVVQKYNLEYYTDCYHVVQLKWNGKWRPYDYVMQFDKRLSIQ